MFSFTSLMMHVQYPQNVDPQHTSKSLQLSLSSKLCLKKFLCLSTNFNQKLVSFNWYYKWCYRWRQSGYLRLSLPFQFLIAVIFPAHEELYKNIKTDNRMQGNLLAYNILYLQIYFLICAPEMIKYIIFRSFSTILYLSPPCCIHSFYFSSTYVQFRQGYPLLTVCSCKSSIYGSYPLHPLHILSLAAVIYVAS